MSGSSRLVLMLGGLADDGPLERLMRGALEASALDTAERALASGTVDGVLLLADRAPAGDVPAGVRVEIDEGDEPFQFGRHLARAVERHAIDRLVYVGAGSAPVLDADGLRALAAGLEGAPGTCVTNNFYSSDFFALAPASAIGRLDPPPATDNIVPRRLKETLAVAVTELPRTTATQLNLDSPIDLLALRLSGRAGPRLSALLAGWAPDAGRLARAAMRLTDRDAEVLVAGRVSARTWQYLERETASRVRMLAEERGMTAAGRDADGSARSILGALIDAIGPEAFFAERLPELCDAAFIDLRPAMVHLGIHAPPADRFAADLGLVDDIEHPRLRAIAAAAAASPIPVVLGAHTLVAGVIMLLNDWAWNEHDRAVGAAAAAGSGAARSPGAR